MYLDDGIQESPENKKLKANINHIKIEQDPNYIPGNNKEDGIKIPLNISFDNGDQSGRALLVLGGRKERLDVALPIKKYKEGEGFIYQNLDTEVDRDQQIIKFLYKYKENIYDALKASPDLLGKKELSDEELDDIVQFPMYADESGLRLKIKVRMKKLNGNIQPMVFHRKDKKHHYDSLEKINQTFDPTPSQPTKRYTSKMTLFCHLENVYFNYKKDMETGEFDKDENGDLKPRLYPIISLYQAVVSDPEEKQGTGLVTKEFELDEFPVEQLSIDAPIADQNDIYRSYVNLKEGDKTIRCQVWLRGVLNLFGMSTSQKTGEPTHMSIPIQGPNGDKIKHIMETLQEKIKNAGVEYSLEFFKKKKFPVEKVVQKMEDDRGQVNIFYPRKRDQEGDITDEIDEDRAPTIKIKVATDPETGEYKFPVCYKSTPDTPLSHEEADHFLRTRGTTYDILFAPKTLSYNSKFSLPLATYKIIAHNAIDPPCQLDEDDSDVE